MRRTFVLFLLGWALALPRDARATGRYLTKAGAKLRVHHRLPSIHFLLGRHGRVELGPRRGDYRRFRVPFGDQREVWFYRAGLVNVRRTLRPSDEPLYVGRF
jgi:hypothetical protein